MTHPVQAPADLSGQIALVTGSSRGLGLQVARTLGAAGAKVMLCARQADALERAMAELQAEGIDARWTVADCQQAAGLQHLVSETLQRMGDVDILVNTVGNHALLSQLLVQHSMRARNAGCIINLACGSAKEAVLESTRALAAQWRPEHITVNALEVGTQPVVQEELQRLCQLLASAPGRQLTGQCLAVAPGSDSPAQDLSFGVAIPFVDHLGFALTRFDSGFSELVFTPQAEHLNSFGVTHGGALMTLLDVTMAVAARSVQKEMGALTIEMKTSFMQAARGPLTGKGRLIHRTATLAFTEATIFDAAGHACAHATGTFKYARRLPTGPKSSSAFNAIATDG